MMNTLKGEMNKRGRRIVFRLALSLGLLLLAIWQPPQTSGVN